MGLEVEGLAQLMGGRQAKTQNALIEGESPSCYKYILVYTFSMFIQRVVQSLKENRVSYALVGGYAVALHGAIRGTVDLDLVIRMEKAQFRKLEQAMKELGLVPRLPVTAEEVFDFREEYIRNRNMVAWSFYHPDNPLEAVDILITEDLRDIKTVSKKLGALAIHVAAIRDLIAMKQKAGRAQDWEDIRALEKLI